MPQFIDTFVSILIEVVKVSISGVIGGFLGSLIILRQFQKQTKFQAKHQRHLDQIESLREILVILPIIYRDIHFKWELPEDSPITSKQHISDLTAQLNRTHSLFLKDPESMKILDSIHSLIGEDRESLLSFNQGMPGVIIERIKTKVESKITEIESKIY